MDILWNLKLCFRNTQASRRYCTSTYICSLSAQLCLKPGVDRICRLHIIEAFLGRLLSLIRHIGVLHGAVARVSHKYRNGHMTQVQLTPSVHRRHFRGSYHPCRPRPTELEIHQRQRPAAALGEHDLLPLPPLNSFSKTCLECSFDSCEVLGLLRLALWPPAI